MNKKLRALFPPVCVAVLTILLFSMVLAFQPDAQHTAGVESISEWQLEGDVVSLPLTLGRLAPRTSLTLTAEVQPEAGAYIYFKTVYAPLRVYANNELIFEYGQPGSYPSFLLDPPTKTALLPLPDTEGTVTLRMEYQSPAQRSSIALHPVLMGTSDAILRVLFREMGPSLFFSVVLLALGLLLFLIALVLTRFEVTGTAFFWLGLFCVCVCSWVFGECNLTGVLIDTPVFLYLLAFMGLFTTAIPLLKFCRTVLGLQKKNLLLLNRTALVLEVCTAAAILLQLSGITAFSKNMYLFHVLVPLAFCVLVGVLLWESVWCQNSLARRFLFPAAALALFALLEVGNYYLFRLPVQKSFFFQIGVLIFVVMSGIVCGYFVRDAFLLRQQNTMTERQVKIQKEQHQMLFYADEKAREWRHSMKHHLGAVQVFLLKKEYELAQNELNKLLNHLSADVSVRLCNNPLVNATALHYQSMAKQAGADVSIKLDIPNDTGDVPDGELCVIVGDLLENAVTACRSAEKPFIRMRSRYADGGLTITMDNSFSYIQQAPDGSFRSTRKGGGMGLRVITALVEKHKGGSRFEVRDGVFYSSVYLRLL